MSIYFKLIFTYSIDNFLYKISSINDVIFCIESSDFIAKS